MKSEKQEFVDVDPTEEEKNRLVDLFEWMGIEPGSKFVDLDIPYVVPVGAAVVTGILHARNPVENSSTDGLVTGAVDGDYHLDKDHGDASVYDPTRAICRVDLHIDFSNKTLSARLCTRSNTFPFPWRCGGWVAILAW